VTAVRRARGEQDEPFDERRAVERTPDDGAGSPGGLTAPVEDYLKAVYELEFSGEAAATSDIAARLMLSPASVSGMVRRLAAQGLLDHVPYKGVRLTADGRRAALRTLRRHRVLESYLATVLGMPWDRVHDEAEALEHAASDDLIDRMAAALGDPRFDPHGAPIPTRDGSVDETRHATLLELPVGEAATVMSVSDDDPAMLRYLAELELRPGCTVRVQARAPFDGPIDVCIGEAVRQVGPTVARAVRVAPVS
jgi:DtxR family Mn-dependent transcriptional regulator